MVTWTLLNTELITYNVIEIHHCYERVKIFSHKNSKCVSGGFRGGAIPHSLQPQGIQKSQCSDIKIH